MEKSVEITSKGIKQILRKHDAPTSIAEYIWNGFDAKATKIALAYKVNELGFITELSVSDNGEGILSSDLSTKFDPFFQSNKEVEIENPKNHSIPKGKQGVGRLTFFTFAGEATWFTCAMENDKLVKQRIQIKSSDIKKYSPIEESVTLNDVQGTTVTFDNIDELSEEAFKIDIYPYLCREFAWFLELNAHKQYQILINNCPLDYSGELREKEEFEKTIKGHVFKFRFRSWRNKLNREYSKYYFLDSHGSEVWKANTTLNNKGDNFYHSLYVYSQFFDEFYWSKNDVADEQDELFVSQKHPDFKELMAFMSRYLYDKREPYLEEFTKNLIEDYAKEGVLPKFGPSPLAQYAKNQLEETVRELYKVSPGVFSGLNFYQKKTFVELLNAMLEMGADDKLLDIIASVVKLTPEERKDFADILHYADITSITRTIGLIKDRYKTILQVKELVFNFDLKANEPDHLQKVIEMHYWIFGEQYNLVTAEEPDFETALRRFTHLLRGEDPGKVRMTSSDKNKEMDIFCCRKDVHIDTVESIIVELKHPTVNLGEEQLAQVKRYMRTILNEDRFNASNRHWKFYLVGNGFAEDNAILTELKNNKDKGEHGLVLSIDNYKIYVKLWSEIFADFDCRYNYLLEKLELDKEKILSESKFATAKEIVVDARANQAVETATFSATRQTAMAEPSP